MIDYLLDLTRIKQGKRLPITTTMTDIEMVCRLIIAELSLTYPNRIISFSAEGNLHGRWDSDRMAQVISNLVANALQHSIDEVKVRACENEDHSVVVSVHNSGDPIPPLLMKTMFDRMITDDTSLSSGLGLGLYIAREIVEAHKGCITVTSSQGEGTTFMVRLPRESSSERPSGCPPEPLE
jgi:signal transduction histidine kinase